MANKRLLCIEMYSYEQENHNVKDNISMIINTIVLICYK